MFLTLVHLADQASIPLREHALAIPALLLNCIHDVFSVFAKKQVVWSYARRIVAAMQNQQTCWDRSKVQFPRQAMCSQCAIGFIAGADLAIAGTEFCSSPKPTGIGLFDIRPKALLESLLHGRGRF